MPIRRRDTSPPPHQESFNGPLSADIRARLNRLRTERNYTLADLGKAIGFSGPFMSTLLRPNNPGRIRTIRIDKFVQALQELEEGEGLTPPRPNGAPPADATAQERDDTLDELIRAIHRKGFLVTLGPMSPR
jgi:hypothetical protein